MNVQDNQFVSVKNWDSPPLAASQCCIVPDFAICRGFEVVEKQP